MGIKEAVILNRLGFFRQVPAGAVIQVGKAAIHLAGLCPHAGNVGGIAAVDQQAVQLPAADQEDLIGRLGGDGFPQFTQ